MPDNGRFIMKKYLSLFMMMLLVVMSIIPVNAIGEEQEQALAPVILYQKGDLNADGLITAEDARLCLRAVVGLEELNDLQRAAADLSGCGVIDSSCARNILRASVGMEQFNSDRIQTSRDVVIIKPFLTAGSGMYQWECTVAPDSEVATVERTSYITAEPVKPGDSVAQHFYINLKSQGTFVFVFKLHCAWTGEVLRQYTLTVEKT